MPCGESGDALDRTAARPAQRQRDLAVGVAEIEGREMAADRGSEPVRVDDLAAFEGRLDDLQIAPRQQRARSRKCSWYCRRAARCIRRRRAPWRGCIRRPAAAARARRRASIRVARWRGRAAGPCRRSRAPRAVDIFGDAAGEHHAVDAARDRRADRSDRDARCLRQRPRRDRGDQRVGHGFGDLVERRPRRRRRRGSRQSRPRAA